MWSLRKKGKNEIQEYETEVEKEYSSGRKKRKKVKEDWSHVRK